MPADFNTKQAAFIDSMRMAEPTNSKTMLAMVEKYTSSFPAHALSSGPPPSTPLLDTVLLTGTTGELGACALAQLLQSLQVKRVYAVNRPGKGAIVERQVAAFVQVGLPPQLVSSRKLVLVEADISGSGLGLSSESLLEMSSSVTHIMHNAWKINHSRPLAAFEPNVRSLRNLIDFALSSSLSSPPRVMFVSSIVAISGPTGSGLERASRIPTDASPTGYAMSKWVAEQVLVRAGADAHLPYVVVRVAQLTGAKSPGRFSPSNWLAALLPASVYLRCLPDFGDKDFGWVPVDVAGRIMFDMRNSVFPVVHISHPVPTAASTIFGQLSTSLKIPTVSFPAWIDAVEHDASQHGGLHRTAAARLVPLYRLAAAYPDLPTRESGSMTRMSIDNALLASEYMAGGEIEQLDKSDVQRWLVEWKAAGLFKSTKVSSRL